MPLNDWSTDSIVAQLARMEMFQGFSEASLAKLVESDYKSQLRLLVPHVKFWEHPKDLELTIILSGCVVVIDRNDDEETSINALLVKGQLVGEFEYLGFQSQGLRLEAVSPDTVVFIPSAQALRDLSQRKAKLFYRNLGRTLVSKLKIQNAWTKLRDKKALARRLASLLKEFQTNQAWQSLQRRPPDCENCFEIDIAWSFGKLEYCLSSSMRSIGKAFQTLMKSRIIEVAHLKDPKVPGINVGADFFNNSDTKPKNTYIRITVVDEERLLRNDFLIEKTKGLSGRRSSESRPDPAGNPQRRRKKLETS